MSSLNWKRGFASGCISCKNTANFASLTWAENLWPRPTRATIVNVRNDCCKAQVSVFFDQLWEQYTKILQKHKRPNVLTFYSIVTTLKAERKSSPHLSVSSPDKHQAWDLIWVSFFCIHGISLGQVQVWLFLIQTWCPPPTFWLQMVCISVCHGYK